VSASSGVTWPSERFSHTLFGVRPRERMSSEKDVSLAKFFSMRAATKLPEPWRRTSSPSSTSPSIAFLTVMREIARSVAIWRSAGSASSGPSARFSIASRSARCSCWYSGRLLSGSSGRRSWASEVMDWILPVKYQFAST
jgi:hypothetical protein